MWFDPRVVSRWRRLARPCRLVAWMILVSGAPAIAQRAVVDTGLLEVPHSFARYDTPRECLHDVEWIEEQFWRARRADTMYIGPAGRLFQEVTIREVRMCLSRFTVSVVTPDDLLALGQAALAANEPALADSALTRLSASVRADRKAPWILSQIVGVYLDAPLPNFARAAAYAARLDAYGVEAAPERLLAHLAFVRRAEASDSVVVQARELAAARAASRAIAGDLQKEYAGATVQVYVGMARLAARRNDPVGARAMLDTGRQVLSAILPGAEQAIDLQAGWFHLLGMPAPPIVATLWVNTGSGGEHRPLTGHPSLVVFWSPSYPSSSVLRRLLQRFGPRGLDVTLVQRTVGFYRNQLVPPDTELVRRRDEIVRTFEIPVAIALWKTELGRRSDGRVTVESAPNDAAYQPPDNSLVTYVIDARGIVRLVTTLARDNEALLNDVLDSLF